MAQAAEAGKSAEQSNESYTENHQRHTHWDHKVHARPPSNANQTESEVDQSKLSATENSHNPLKEAMKDAKGWRLGWGMSWMGLTEDSRCGKGIQTYLIASMRHSY